MLEQAVYAGRNHIVSLAVAVTLLVMSSAPARATGSVEAAHVALGTTLGTVLAGPDGGAWVRVERHDGGAIGRVTADGTFRTAAVEDPLNDQQAALGPDGQAWFAPAAYAGDVTRVALGSSIEDLITGTDGGAWVNIFRPRHTAIGRATPDGRFVTARLDDVPVGTALGPDGQAWFRLDGSAFVRSDAAGTLSTVRVPSDGPVVGEAMATGPDGTLWAITPPGDRVAHITPVGDVTSTAANIPDCGDTEFTASGSPSFTTMERASDGAMWISDAGCTRLVRIAATGTAAFSVKLPDPGALAADASGGMWFAGERPGHVDAAGAVRRFDIDRGDARDVAVAPDGSAWYATGTCTLTRVTAGGELTTAPTPIPAGQVGFDPAGGMWLASRARLVHIAPGEGFGTCDDRPPSVRLRPGGGSIGLRALRHAGIGLAVREPVSISVLGFYAEDANDGSPDAGDLGQHIVTQARGRTVHLRVPAEQLRRFERLLAGGKRPELGLFVNTTDREGNGTIDQFSVRVR
jgi:streptogramin lyase